MSQHFTGRSGSVGTKGALFHPMFRDKPLHNFLFETDETGFYKNLSVFCTPWIDQCCLLHLIRRYRPARFLEVGTHRGMTTKTIAEKFPKMEITTVDPGDRIPNVERPRNQAGEYLPTVEVGVLCRDKSNVRQVIGSFSNLNWTGQQFEMIFIDGNHSYEAVLQDSQVALQLVTNPGVIVWHDVKNVRDVELALRQLKTPRDICHIHNTWIAYHDTH